MLSTDYANKLCMTGLYRCDPILSYLPSYKRQDPYWSNNWTFRVKKVGDEYYMCDTYWSNGGDSILLTDENFGKFELIFDFNDVEECKHNWQLFDEKDRWVVAIDSGGLRNRHYFVRRGSRPKKKLVIQKLKEDNEYLRNRIIINDRLIQQVVNDEIDTRYV